MTEAETLQRQRAAVKANVTRIKNLVTNTMSSSELECRLGLVEAYFKQLLSIQSDIEIHNPKDNSRADLEELCILTKTKIIDLMGDNYKRSIESSFAIPATAKSKLPKLHLPHFDGKYAAYKNFISTFKQLVDNDSSLSEIERFNHLLHCLSGQALDTIRAFEITGENYRKALQRLDERYDNKTLIFLEHISNIYELPSVNKPSALQLRALIDNASAIYSSLRSLGSVEDICNAMLIHLILIKVDSESNLKWKEAMDFSSLPSWENFTKILERRCQFLESIEPQPISNNKSNATVIHEKQNISKRRQQNHSFVAQVKRNCIFCKRLDHWSNHCSQFKSLDSTSRFDTVKKLGICINCLSPGHNVSNCTSKHRCKACKNSHHTLLHRESPSTSSTTYQPVTQATVNTHLNNHSSSVILATAIILISDSTGEYKLARALLDSCSQVNLITEKLAGLLNLPRRKTFVEVSGVGESSSKMKCEVESTIRSRFNSHEFSVGLLVTNRISGYLPSTNIDITKWRIPEIDMADEFFYKQQSIDLLLGTEYFFDILLSKKLSLGPNMPTFQETQAGWIVTGRYVPDSKHSITKCMVTTAELNDLNNQMQFLWKMEEIHNPTTKWTPEQKSCETHFTENVATNSSGRIIVKLPFKEHFSTLGSSYNAALKRFHSLERRLSRDNNLKAQYSDFMTEYEQLGHMSLITNADLTTAHYFIPHHCVLRPNSSSTKLRVVFDASAKTTSEKSLNDILLVGPTIQDDLCLQVLRFRMYRFVLTGDIVKMYRMFLIHESHRPFQYILWRPNENQPINVYQLNTITYGMSASPFLAIRSLQFLAAKFEFSHKIGASVIRNHFYVDDMLTGASTIEELNKIKEEVLYILSKGGLEMAKFQSNHPSFQSDNTSLKNMNMEKSQVTSALGINWDPVNDNFLFTFKAEPRFSTYTKRAILSLTASVFDPMGLISPIIITLRVLLQNLWLQNYDWDTEVPVNVKNALVMCLDDLQNLNQISIPRFVLTKNYIDIQLHGFSDASLRAYGCCFYVTTRDQFNHFSSVLFAARCRVAPTKKRTMPQLELCGAHLLSVLYRKIAQLFKSFVPRVYFWTDSSVVLRWLQLHSSTLTTFVGNRISEIQETTAIGSWRHVPTALNPADLISRGCSLQSLKSSSWFAGPEFLKHPEQQWPNSLGECDENVVKSAVRSSLFKCEINNNSILKLCEKSSSYLKTVRVVTLLFRFVRDKTALNAELQQHAIYCIAWNLQQFHFSSEITYLNKGVDIKTSLKSLGLFIDKGINFPLVRVGGRLENANIPYSRKHPILLPNCNFVLSYIRYLHLSNYHAGPRALIAFSRQTFWIINVRNIARKVVRSCISCIRYRPKLMEQIMGDLPRERVTPARPFERCGVDFFGPIDTYYKIRGKRPTKSYGAIFICFVTKAVHIELVSNLSAEAFIAALKRLIGRRGLPSDIYSDNATNFVGANNKLIELKNAFLDKQFQDSLNSFCSNNFINFHFIPPRAPHFGGLWEAAVKSAKGHLYRTLAGAKLTFEELSTTLIEIEAIMNSRPIAALSTDPNDIEALTPGHFLVNGPLNSLPERPIQCDNISLLERWQRICAAKQKFWHSWSSDYLHEIIQRKAWQKTSPDLKPGMLVLVHEDNLAPLHWLKGRIVATAPGKDGKIRVADVKTIKGTIRRPITKLAVLLDS